MICILTEKPSAAKNFATAFGGFKGTYRGQDYIIVNSVGHIFEYPDDPSFLVKASLADKYKNWDTKNLPWNEKDFVWKKKRRSGTKDIFDNIKEGCMKADEIIIATDNDPTGEGTLLADEILLNLNLRGKTFSRMFFEDESVKSIQKAFKNRVDIEVLEEDPDYIKADYRSKWDYLSMQFTRIASNACKRYAVLRNGRLKSFMNTLVGDELEAYNNYKPISTYQDAFRDEEGVWYIKKDNKTYPKKEDVSLKDLHESSVIHEKPIRKSTPPPKLLDLAALSSILASLGYKAGYVKDIYQKMYNDSVVSYPRTEDSVITYEQFNDLLPNIDTIADLVGIDKIHLTHRTPRTTHVKKSATHGANRPGSNIPSSLSNLDTKYGRGASLIYKTLAVNTLTMFCEDYVYDVLSGYVKDFPDYKGSVTTPVSLGYRNIWSTDDDEKIEEKSLGNIAKPAIKEIIPKRPPYPTMKWLMKQLEKYNVGTGATRTGVYAEVTNEKAKYPLMKDDKGKITLTVYGADNYILLKNTHIGSSQLTEQLQNEMKYIADNPDTNIYDLLHNMQNYVTDDLKTMMDNSKNLKGEKMDNINEVTEYTCPICGGAIIKKNWGYTCENRTEDGDCHFAIGNILCQREIPEEQQIKLINEGSTDIIRGFISAKGNTFNAKLIVDKEKGGTSFEFAEREIEIIDGMNCPICGKPLTATSFGYGCSGYRTNGCRFSIGTLCGKKLTETQVKNLLKGNSVKVRGMKSKAGKKFDAEISLVVEKGNTKFNFSF